MRSEECRGHGKTKRLAFEAHSRAVERSGRATHAAPRVEVAWALGAESVARCVVSAKAKVARQRRLEFAVDPPKGILFFLIPNLGHVLLALVRGRHVDFFLLSVDLHEVGAIRHQHLVPPEVVNKHGIALGLPPAALGDGPVALVPPGIRTTSSNSILGIGAKEIHLFRPGSDAAAARDTKVSAVLSGATFRAEFYDRLLARIVPLLASYRNTWAEMGGAFGGSVMVHNSLDTVAETAFTVSHPLRVEFFHSQVIEDEGLVKGFCKDWAESEDCDGKKARRNHGDVRAECACGELASWWCWEAAQIEALRAVND